MTKYHQVGVFALFFFSHPQLIFPLRSPPFALTNTNHPPNINLWSSPHLPHMPIPTANVTHPSQHLAFSQLGVGNFSPQSKRQHKHQVYHFTADHTHLQTYYPVVLPTPTTHHYIFPLIAQSCKSLWRNPQGRFECDLIKLLLFVVQ